MFTIIDCNLQLFADGGEGGFSAGVAEGSAVNSADYGQVAADTDGATTDSAQADADAELEANYKSMISGEYKDIHKRYFEKQMGRRLKGKDKEIAELTGFKEQASTILDKLAIKYGVSDPTNIEAIMKAADEDTSYYEEYALNHGVDIDTAKQLIKAERITAENDRRLAEEQEMAKFQAQYDEWMQEAQQTQMYYPDFDFDYEVENEFTGDNFKRLLNSGVDVKTAYEVVHKDEMMGGAMKYAYTTARNEMADARTARTQRPVENGISNQQASAVVDDMSHLSKAEMQKLKDAVARGEKINKDNFRRFIS